MVFIEFFEPRKCFVYNVVVSHVMSCYNLANWVRAIMLRQRNSSAGSFRPCEKYVTTPTRNFEPPSSNLETIGSKQSRGRINSARCA